VESDMNPYAMLASGIGASTSSALAVRLATWHDAMVAHERRLRAGSINDACDEDCAHGEARALWAEAVTTFGERAHQLSFLRSRAMGAAGPFKDGAVPATAERSRAFDDRRARQRARQTDSGRRQPSCLLRPEHITEEYWGVLGPRQEGRS
jgi:hypothetical protein